MVVDQRRVLGERPERLDPALDEGLLVLGILVLGVLAEIAVLLGVVDPACDLGTPDGHRLVQLASKLFEAFPGGVGGVVVHLRSAPEVGLRLTAMGGPAERRGARMKGKNPSDSGGPRRAGVGPGSEP